MKNVHKSIILGKVHVKVCTLVKTALKVFLEEIWNFH